MTQYCLESLILPFTEQAMTSKVSVNILNYDFNNLSKR